MAWFIAVSRDRGPENGLHENVQRTRWSAEWVRQALSQQWCFYSQLMIFVKRFNDMVISYIQVVSPMSWSTYVD